MVKIQSIDTTGLNRALDIARQYGQRTPQTMVATAGYYIAKNTSRGVRRAGISEIDSKLGVVAVTPRIATRGPRKGQPLKSGRKTFDLGPMQSAINTPAAGITLARLWPESRYNKLTNDRWALDRADFSPGQGSAGFWQKIIQLAQAMVGRRHGSVAFLASSLIPIIQYLGDRMDARYKRFGGATDPQAAAHARRSEYPQGKAQLSTNGNTATMEGDLLIGMNNSKLAQQQNQAMHRWIAPVLQREIFAEETRQIAYATAKEEMLLKSPELMAAGVTLT